MDSVEALAPYLAGPGAAVVVLLVVLGAIYRLTVTYGLPLVQGAVDRHLAQIDRMLDQHREEAEATMGALRSLNDEVTEIRRRISAIETREQTEAF